MAVKQAYCRRNNRHCGCKMDAAQVRALDTRIADAMSKIADAIIVQNSNFGRFASIFSLKRPESVWKVLEC